MQVLPELGHLEVAGHRHPGRCGDARRRSPGGAVASARASVAFTYNDPTIFAEYAIDTAIACREVGVRTVAVTAGYIMAEPRVEFYEHMDAANIDLKGFTEEFYRKVCGAELPKCPGIRLKVRSPQGLASTVPFMYSAICLPM